MMGFTFFFPCLTNHLTKEYDLSISTSSLFFSVPIFNYFIMINLVNIISEKVGNFNSMMLGMIFNTMAVYLIYPLSPFPKNIISIIFGLSLIGAGGPLILILSLIELSKTVKKISTDYDQNTINDIASAMNNFFASNGDLLGPIVGGFLSSNFGFKVCCIILFSIFLIFSLIFFHYYDKNNNDDNKEIEKNYIENLNGNNQALKEDLFK